MKIEIFKSSKGIITNLDFEKFIGKFDLEGKEVLVYSRLLDFGRLISKKSVESILEFIDNTIEQEKNIKNAKSFVEKNFQMSSFNYSLKILISKIVKKT